MKRYKELKIDGKIITKDIEIESILINNNFNWILDAEIGNARLEITKNTLVWNSGTWYNGDWYYGVFRNGEFKSGTFINGVWYNGIFRNGLILYALIFDGKFINGEIRNGEIRGGKFYSIKIFSNVIRKDLKEDKIDDEENIKPIEMKIENKIYRFKDFLRI